MQPIKFSTLNESCLNITSKEMNWVMQTKFQELNTLAIHLINFLFDKDLQSNEFLEAFSN